MNYLTTSEVAAKWNLSRRRVTVFCTEGRIEGAIIKGNHWLIPDDAVKPQDPRRQRKLQRRESETGELTADRSETDAFC